MGAEQKAKAEVVQEAAPGALKPAPKSRGRPAGSKDNKPRIKRVPVQQQQETAAKEATPTALKPRKKVEIRYGEEAPDAPEEQLPPPKSPRTLHKERVQAAAMQRRQVAQARPDHFFNEFWIISWASCKRQWQQKGCWNQCRETSNRLFEMRFVVACFSIAPHRHELLCCATFRPLRPTFN